MTVYTSKYDVFENISEEEITYITILIEYISVITKNNGEIGNTFSTKFLDIFKKFQDSDNISLRTKTSNCLLDLLKQKKEFIYEDFEFFFSYFFDNYTFENYYLNLSASEFFLFLIENYENGFKLLVKEDAKDFAISNSNEAVGSQINSTNLISIYFEKNLKE